MIFPQWTIGNILLYGYLAFMALAIGPMELRGLAMMEYSKFHVARGLPSRTGMLIVYSLPLLALALSGLPYGLPFTVAQGLVFGAIAFAFTKRIIEGLFVHKYSGTMSLPTVGLIAGLYSLASFMIGWNTVRMPPPPVDAVTYAGLALYGIGVIGNYLHHKMLADLRRDSLEYVIPRGGMFELVICPHYLFEIVIWLGIFLLSRHFAAFLTLAFIIAYLSARAIRTLRWYRDKFTNFPKERKAILPFIF